MLLYVRQVFISINSYILLEKLLSYGIASS